MDPSSAYKSSSSSSLELHALMRLDTPRVVLGGRIVKGRKVRSPPPVLVPQRGRGSPPRLSFVSCSLCTHSPGDQQMSILCIPSSDPNYLTSVLGRSAGGLIFCSVCRRALIRLHSLRESVVDMEARVRGVVKLARTIMMMGDSGGGLQQLMMSPQVLLQRREGLIIIKQEHVVVKMERESSPEQTPSVVPCSNCGTLLHPLFVLSGTDSDWYLRSLLSRDEDLAFCSVCRAAATRLLTLREELGDLETRIRAVVKLRGPLEGHKCVHCGKEFNSQKALSCHFWQRHKNRNKTTRDGGPPPHIPQDGWGLYACPEVGCRHRATFRCNLFKHLLTIHGLTFQPSALPCPTCKKVFRNPSLFEAHSHPDDRDPGRVLYTCALCHKGFGRSTSLLEHTKAIHLGAYQSNCPACGKTFSRKEALARHRRSCPLQSQEFMRCHHHLCGMVFSSWREGWEHERVVHRGLSSTKCYFCSHILRDADALVRHMRTHTLERPFLCELCGRDFATKSSLASHTDRACGSDEGRKAVICARDRADSLKRRELPPLFVCDHCGKGFYFKAGFLSHIRWENRRRCSVLRRKPLKDTGDDFPMLEEGGRQFHGCPECGKKLTRKANVILHLKRVHGLRVIQTRRKECPICGMLFIRREHFQAHSHPDPKGGAIYTCALCHKTFDQLTQLVAHKKRAHVVGTKGELRFNKVQRIRATYKCYFCSKVTSAGWHLARHMKIHTMERPFWCNKCGRDYKESRDLKVHIRKATCVAKNLNKKGWNAASDRRKRTH